MTTKQRRRLTLEESQRRQDLYEQGLRPCKRCQRVLPLDSFGANSIGAQGLHSACKECERERQRAMRSNDPLSYRIYRSRQRAVEAGNRADRFSPSDLRAHWQAIGIDPNVSAYSGEPLPTNWHLDHIVPIANGGGHTLDNLVPCLPSENGAKKNLHFIHLLAKIHAPKEAA